MVGEILEVWDISYDQLNREPKLTKCHPLNDGDGCLEGFGVG